MDLERELRLAMAEHLDGAKAPEELATAVSRHHRCRGVQCVAFLRILWGPGGR